MLFSFLLLDVPTSLRHNLLHMFTILFLLTNRIRVAQIIIHNKEFNYFFSTQINANKKYLMKIEKNGEGNEHKINCTLNNDSRAHTHYS